MDPPSDTDPQEQESVKTFTEPKNESESRTDCQCLESGKTQLQLGHASFFPFKFLTAQVLAVLNFLCSHNNNNNKNTFYL